MRSVQYMGDKLVEEACSEIKGSIWLKLLTKPLVIVDIEVIYWQFFH